MSCLENYCKEGNLSDLDLLGWDKHTNILKQHLPCLWIIARVAKIFVTALQGVTVKIAIESVNKTLWLSPMLWWLLWQPVFGCHAVSLNKDIYPAWWVCRVVFQPFKAELISNYKEMIHFWSLDVQWIISK